MRGKHANKHAHARCQRVVCKLTFGIAEELSSPRLNANGFHSKPCSGLIPATPWLSLHEVHLERPTSTSTTLALGRNSVLQAIDMRPACTGNLALYLRQEPEGKPIAAALRAWPRCTMTRTKEV